MMVMPQQNSTALIALILAIVSFIGLSLLGAIPAVILGRNARKEIQASNGMMTGDGMAQAAVILGWINIGLSLIGMCFFCVIPFLTILGTQVSG
jgi:quinol-cytochrome oxidoreductase complex cytochrome b subunit